VALARRIIRDYTSRSQESDFGLADVDEVSLTGLDGELHWYLTQSRPTYAKMSEMHKPVSDLVVDGTKSPEEIVEEIIKFIENKELQFINKNKLNKLTLFLIAFFVLLLYNINYNVDKNHYLYYL